ncbi:chromosome partitioning protein [Xanthomonas arboricola]|uniref:AAA family ATPase n=1 Tax=Xanthomonas euroxanthea TaxID=2259622 RepID=A0A8E4DNL7_9XANT|nr:AAA family ATPase [Xanthomonas euroxanthea]NJC37290.1 chromosome partitioning protein [Xanthomonas euroxanthea]CAD1786170.1 AAA family ATPase [Xanthomonas euroxanthea]SYZ50781.1 ParA family protein [Xanthomonas arboricola pv. juglandis]
MDIVAVINYKGGVGKTTVTSNLAAELAHLGNKVLLIDTDAQASLTFSFVTPDDWNDDYKSDKTIKSWFDAVSSGSEPPPLESFVITPSVVNSKVGSNGGKIDLICSHLGLINVDLELATLLGGVNIQQTKRNYIKVHGKLREAIHRLAETSDYDIVLIDCPPNFNIVTKNAIVAAQKILIPAKPDYLSTLGIDYLSKSVKDLVREFNEYAQLDGDVDEISPEIMGVVFTMIQIKNGQPISAQRQFISQTNRLGVKTFKAYLRENKTIFADAPQNLLPVVLNNYPAGTHADVVNELEDFVEEFVSEVSLGDL